MTDNNPEFVVQKAILFEKMNNIDSAKNAYFFAKKIYEKKMAVKPDDINSIKGSIYLQALINSKDSAINELDRQIKMHPALVKELNNERYFYENFDRKALTNRFDY